MKYLKDFFSNLTNATGRTTVKEFWMTVLWLSLFNLCVSGIFYLIGLVVKLPTLATIIAAVLSVVILFGTIAMQIRRLHDTNRSGVYIFFSFIPVIGQIMMLVFFCLPSDPNTNNYGEPKISK